MKTFEKRIYSQNGEDGIIEYIFNTIGTTNQVAVEFGVERGTESNTRFLAEKNWRCIWFDGMEADLKPKNVEFYQVWLTADNIVKNFEIANVPTEFDLLSIDVDGNDYHLRAALKDYRPRVCVQEYNGCYDPTQPYIMERDDDYRWKPWSKKFGASLLSLSLQADELGYDLVYCESRGVNVFFIRKDINCLPRLSVEEAFVPLWWASRV